MEATTSIPVPEGQPIIDHQFIGGTIGGIGVGIMGGFIIDESTILSILAIGNEAPIYITHR